MYSQTYRLLIYIVLHITYDYSTFYQLANYQNLPLRMCNIRVAVAMLATLHEYVPLSLADAVAR